MERHLTYFVSDVHLGLDFKNPKDRERRFVDFLRKIPADSTEALYLMGDIWDFWYEWKYTVPKGYVKVFAAIIDLIDAGVKVYYFRGNHDIWTYSYFKELGMVELDQPAFVSIGGKTFCLGHGNGLGRATFGYRVLSWVFNNKLLQTLFSALVHPTVSMALGNAWSRRNRLGHKYPYRWKGKDEPLYRYALSVLESREVDCFIFGHFHVSVDEQLPGGARLVILDSWLDKDAGFVYDASAE